MSAADFQSRQQIVQEFKRRRGREIAMAIPFIAAVLIAWQAYDDPDFLLFGLSGVPLFGTALGVVAACLAHHAFNWRCPACHHHFRTGISVPFCPQCGAVFEESRDPLAMADPDAARREQVENAVQAELKMYQSKYALHLMRGMVSRFPPGKAGRNYSDRTYSILPATGIDEFPSTQNRICSPAFAPICSADPSGEATVGHSAGHFIEPQLLARPESEGPTPKRFGRAQRETFQSFL